MKLKIKPLIVYSKHLPFKGFVAMALLFVVIVRKVYNEQTDKWEKRPLPEHTLRHETIHVWQQVCLFLLGLVVAVLSGVVVRLSGNSVPFWVWLIPVLLPFILYVMFWLIELVLPPFKTAYRDICFEGEALYNQHNKEFKFIPFSFLYYVCNRDWKKLGEDKFLV